MSLTPEQQEHRRHAIGASELGSILGRSPYGSAFSVWTTKAPQPYVPQPESPEQARGTLLEPAVLKAWEKATGGVIISRPTNSYPMNHHRLIVTPDGIGADSTEVNEQIVVEAKTVAYPDPDEWGPEFTDQIPDRFLFQTQATMGVLGLKRCDLQLLTGGFEFRTYRIEFNAELFGVLVEKADAFWRDYVEPQKPPPFDGSDVANDWLERKYPRRSKELLPVTPAVAVAANGYDAARLQAKWHEGARLKYAQDLKSLIGDSGGFQGDGFKVTWSQNKPSIKTDWEGAFAELATQAAFVVSAHDPSAQSIRALSDSIERVKNKYTVEKPGADVLRVTFKGEK